MLFVVPVSATTASNLKHPDKQKLRETIIRMRKQGKGYREIGNSLGIHWTRVEKIIGKSK